MCIVHCRLLSCSLYDLICQRLQRSNASATFALRPKAARALFANLEQLVSVHTRFYAQLKDKVQVKGDAMAHIDESTHAFARLVLQFAPLFKMYVAYGLSYTANVESTLQKIQRYYSGMAAGCASRFRVIDV
jgi:hypothetical protein